MQSFLTRWVVSPLQGITLRRLGRLLSEEQIFVDPRYLPRALLTALLSLGNSIPAYLENRRYGERIRATRVERPVFILGHYRHGTTHLHNLMAVDERFGFPNYYQVSFPETFLTTENTGSRLGALLTPGRRPHDNVALGLASPAEDELALCATSFLSPHMAWHFPSRAEHYRRYLTVQDVSPHEREEWKASLLRFARKLTLKQQRPLVFKSPCHTARVGLIREVLPDARFVHIHRDPYTVFQSTRHMERTVSPLFQFQHRDLSDLDEFILWRYRVMYEAFFERRREIPRGRFVEVDYEGLVRDPLGTLRRIYGGLGLPDFEEARPAVERYLSGLGDYRRNRYRDLEPGLRRRIARAWRRCFEEWNYPTG